MSCSSYNPSFSTEDTMKILDQLYQGMVKQELAFIFLIGSFIPIYSETSGCVPLCYQAEAGAQSYLSQMLDKTLVGAHLLGDQHLLGSSLTLFSKSFLACYPINHNDPSMTVQADLCSKYGTEYMLTDQMFRSELKQWYLQTAFNKGKAMEAYCLAAIQILSGIFIIILCLLHLPAHRAVLPSHY